MELSKKNLYKIEGITCDSCRKTIILDLEENGFAGFNINDRDELMIPEKFTSQISKIKSIVEQSAKYKLR